MAGWALLSCPPWLPKVQTGLILGLPSTWVGPFPAPAPGGCTLAPHVEFLQASLPPHPPCKSAPGCLHPSFPSLWVSLTADCHPLAQLSPTAHFSCCPCRFPNTMAGAPLPLLGPPPAHATAGPAEVLIPGVPGGAGPTRSCPAPGGQCICPRPPAPRPPLLPCPAS